MKHLKKYNENNNVDLDIGGLKCDNPNCDYNDPTVPLSDYEKSIGMPCPECGENLLSQEDYDQVMQIVQAVEMINKMNPEDIQKITANLSDEEIDSALDKMNQLKLRKEDEDSDGNQHWSGSLGKDIRSNESMNYIKRFK